MSEPGIVTYVTATGSRYTVDYGRGFWRKNQGVKNRVYWAHGVSAEEAKKCQGWGDINDLPHLPVGVGTLLYIGSKDEWWLSTEIVEVIHE